ncbi:GGDEF domain-containing protein [Pseudidiomarina salilacus]|uniref:GGDEF domain-containing protein n=1 Tax=Pseudidiomarina salilacus TaxID=3384452 RepID=UPI0039846C50
MLPPAHSPLDPLYRRVQFLKALLWVFLFVALVLGAINQLIEGNQLLAVVHYLCFAIAVGFLVWLYWHPPAAQLIAWLTTLVIAAVLIAYTVMAAGQHYALYWLAIFPPIAYFLLGRTWGFSLSVMVIGGILIYIGQVYDGWNAAPFTMRSFGNIIIATAALIVILRHIEKTRAEAFQYLEQHSERLEYIAVTDPLTGLNNRGKLDQALSRALRRAKNEKLGCCVILIDIDHFKRVNDDFGHQTGDRVLIELAQLFRSNLRATDIVGRWGGEEFLIVLPASDRQQGKVLAEKIRITVEAFVFVNEIRITVSSGVACYQVDDSEQTLMRRADQALYAAKAQGRNRTITDLELDPTTDERTAH